MKMMCVDGAGAFKGYLCSLSSRTVVYKGLVDCGQLGTFYPDLRDPRVQSHVALVHARFALLDRPSRVLFSCCVSCVCCLRGAR